MAFEIGKIETVVRTGEAGYTGDGEMRCRGDGKPARQASIMGARAVCIDSQVNTLES